MFPSHDQEGQLGLEETFDEYLDGLWLLFNEIQRALTKDGTCWVNLGDSYYTYQGATDVTRAQTISTQDQHVIKSFNGKRNFKDTRLQGKSLCMIPERFAIGMLDRGWILRNTIIWHKPSCMPFSGKDRFTVDFEKLFFFTKSPQYYFEQQKLPAKDVESYIGMFARS